MDQQNTFHMFQPKELIDQLMGEAFKLKDIGCLQEAQSLLEKAALFSCYSNKEAIENLNQIYSTNKNYKEKYILLWKNTAEHALLNHNDEDFLKAFAKLQQRDDFSTADLQIALTLYAETHRYYTAADIPNLNVKEKIHLGIVAQDNLNNGSYHFIERLARNNTVKNADLSFFFLHDPYSAENNGELSHQTYEYLNSFNYKTIVQEDKSQTATVALDFFIQHFKQEAPDALLFISPNESSLLTFITALHLTPTQMAFISEEKNIPTKLNCIFLDESNSYQDEKATIKYSQNNESMDFVKIIYELLSPTQAEVEIPAVQEEAPEEIAEEHTQEETKQVEAAIPNMALKTLLSDTNTPNVHQNEHPLSKIARKKEKKKSGRKKARPAPIYEEKTRENTAAISKEEMRDFWEKFIYKDSFPLNQVGAIQEDQKVLDNSSINEMIDAAIHILKNDNPDRALKLLLSINKMDKPVKDLFYVRALCYIQLKEFLQALTAIQIEISHFPDNTKAKLLYQEINKTIADNYK